MPFESLITIRALLPFSVTMKERTGGILFPVSQIHKELRKRTRLRVGMAAAVSLGATLQYLTGEVCALSGRVATCESKSEFECLQL